MESNNTKAASKYALITAAHNEQRYIDSTIMSVLSQTVLPQRWVIVSDGSTDLTDEIVRSYVTRFHFIRFVRIDEEHDRNFASKGRAIEAGYQELKEISYEFIGNLDADVSLDDCYFAQLLEKFAADPCLGVAGGFVLEKCHGEFRSRRSNSKRSVAHAAQLCRRACYESVGAYVPLQYGGEDWYAEINARMKGWRTSSFPELRVLHHRRTGTAGGLLRHWFRQGQMDNSLGSNPLFEIVKCLRRLPEGPVLAGAVARLAGFVCFYFQGEERPGSPEFIRFLRREQVARLLDWLPGLPGRGPRPLGVGRGSTS